MKVTLIKGGDPLEEWGAAKIVSQWFRLPKFSARTLKDLFPKLQPLNLEKANIQNLPVLTCNCCNNVQLHHEQTLAETLVSTHIYSSMKILESKFLLDSPLNGVYLICEKCWHELTALFIAAETNQVQELCNFLIRRKEHYERLAKDPL